MVFAVTAVVVGALAYETFTTRRIGDLGPEPSSDAAGTVTVVDVPPRSQVDLVADAACACTTLACAASQHHELTLLLNGDVHHTALRRLTICIDTLAEQFLTEVRAVTDDLCSCADRACYDALDPQVWQVFSEDNVANVGPQMLERLATEVERFNSCDRRFTP